MKILAIRGKNLASLSAEFVVDFQSEPLASAGLYAITGPTGSGKSTLLDALCLALYERTPRLLKATTKGESIPDVGDNTVTPSDPRTILRRGTGEGFAEVDFLGCDGVGYRSRWSARRARLKGDGKLQASEITLVRIADGQRLGDHTKTETLRLIEACIGLSFDQFTRAVLLAQNDFATFLKAPDDERAELLQTLTGTETFSDISKQAFVRMKTEKDALDRLQTQLKDQQALAPEVRTEKTIQIQTQEESGKALEAQKVDIEGHLRWFEQWMQRKTEQTDATGKLDEAAAAYLAAAPRHAHLTLMEQVQPARPLWSEVERLTQTSEVAIKAEASANAALGQFLQQEQTCQTSFDIAKQQVASADVAKAQAQAGINKAKELDVRIDTHTPQLQAAVQVLEKAQNRLNAALASKTETTAKMQFAQDEQRTADNWLADNAQLRPLAEGWQRWETLFEQAQATLAKQTTEEAEVSNLVKQADANATAAAIAQIALEQATESSTIATEKLDTLIQVCTAVDADKLAVGKRAREDGRDHLQAASLLWQRRTDMHAQHHKFQEEQKVETAALADSEEELQACMLSQPLLESQLHCAEQALHLAKLAASENAETMRAELQPDQPCPVCGALEHPYVTHSPVVDAMLQVLQDHVKERQKAVQELHFRSAHAVAEKARAAKAIEQITKGVAQLETLRAQLLVEWAALAIYVEIDAVPESDRTTWLLVRQDEARLALVEFTQQEFIHRENLKLKEAAQQGVNTAIKTYDQANDALRGLLSTGIRVSLAMEATHRQLTDLARQLEASQGQLDAAFSNQTWRHQWSAAPGAFVAQCHVDAKAWGQRQERTTTLMHSIEALRVHLAGCKTACAQATQQRDIQMAACDTLEATLEGYGKERARLFEGMAVAEVEVCLETAIAQAKSSLERSQSAMQQVQADVSRLQESVRQSGMLLEQQRSGQSKAKAALDSWLETLNASQSGTQNASVLLLDELQSLLAITQVEIVSERVALQTVKNAVTSAQAVLDARKHSLATHETEKNTSDSEETLVEELLKATVAISALLETLSSLKLDIARDDERLQASASLQGQIDTQAAVTKVWSQLGELIGSADGKKFRNFAQQLTLDILLGYGNSHLQSLTSRYRLERIKDSLGLLVVDQDMGDEVRSVHSLSGGESFLVSLAMALGLASLSSHRVRVESLFIDEGFGSLDSDSLRVAMDALDSLQAQGRKVGVISHIHEMTERIGTRVQVQRQAAGLSQIVVA